MTSRVRRVVAVAVIVITTGAVAAWAVSPSDEPVAATHGFVLVREQNGLLIDPPFDRVASDRRLQDTYEFNGDAGPSHGFVHATGEGLRVGVRPPEDARNFLGWFAVTLHAYPKSGVYHVRMTHPAGTIAGRNREAEAVFAVQTASTKVTGLINFVEVVSDSTGGQTRWQVDYAHGHVENARNILYWRSSGEFPGATQDVTLRMDGHRSLTVWLGDRRVFSSNDLNMNIEAPFQPYLEVQALRTPYVATFRDFWVTRSSAITVSGLAPDSITVLRDVHGAMLARATASTRGTCVLDLPAAKAHGTGVLTVEAPGTAATQLGAFSYAGGDHYRVTRK